MSQNVTLDGQPESAGRDAAIVRLAAGATVAEAAQAAGVTERTIFRWQAEAAFRSEISTARTRLFDRALGRLAASAATAADTMSELSDTAAAAAQPGASVRLAAARATLEIGRKLWETIELEASIRSLKALVDEITARKHPGHNGVGGRRPSPCARATHAEQSPNNYTPPPHPQ
jgi:hypothetical protein